MKFKTEIFLGIISIIGLVLGLGVFGIGFINLNVILSIFGFIIMVVSSSGFCVFMADYHRR
jgi:hypothetical protein